MHAETRNEVAVAIEETVLKEDLTYTRPASAEHQRNEQFYLCSTSVTSSYGNTVTVDLLKKNAFLQTAAAEAMVIIETQSHFDRQVKTTFPPPFFTRRKAEMFSIH